MRKEMQGGSEGIRECIRKGINEGIRGVREVPITEVQEIRARDIVKMLREKKLVPAPWQRDPNSWSQKNMKVLVETLLKGINPGFLCLSLRDGVYYILDGLQRVTTIRKFYKGSFGIREGEEKFPDLSEEDQQIFLDSVVKAEVYLNLTEERELEIYRGIQNQIPINPNQRILSSAYGGTPNIAWYCLGVNSSLTDMEVLSKTLRMAKDRHKRSRYLVLVASIVLTKLTGGITPVTLTDEHQKILEGGGEHLDYIKECYGENGDILVKDIKDFCQSLSDKGYILTSRQAFISSFVKVYIGGGDFDTIIKNTKSVRREFRDILDPTQKKEILEDLDAIRKAKTRKVKEKKLQEWKKKYDRHPDKKISDEFMKLSKIKDFRCFPKNIKDIDAKVDEIQRYIMRDDN